MRKLFFTCLICWLCCLNTDYLSADTINQNIVESPCACFDSDNASNKEYQEVTNELRQYCDKRYDNYLSHINTVMIWPSLLITLLVALFGICVPIIINKRFEKKYDKVEENVKEYKNEIDTKVDEVKQVIDTKVGDVKRDIDTKVGDVKRDIDTKVGDVKRDIDTKVGDVKKDIDTKVGDVKKAIDTKVDEVKSDIANNVADVKKQIDNKTDEFNREIVKSNSTLNELRNKVNDHDIAFMNFIKKEYEKKEKISLNVPVTKANQELITILQQTKTQEDRNDAINELTRIINNEPSAFALNVRGSFYFDLHDYARSKEDFESAIALAPNEAMSYNNLGRVYNALEKYNQAIPFFNTAIEKEKRFALAYHNRGYSYRHMGEFNLSFNDSIAAIDLDNTFADAYNSLASLYRDIKDYNNAIKYTKIAKGLDESNPWTYNGWAIILIAQECYEEAYGKSLKALECAKRPELYDTCAKSLMKMGDFEKAKKMCELGLSSNPDVKTQNELNAKMSECKNKTDNNG